jgi:hypothetical protein
MVKFKPVRSGTPKGRSSRLNHAQPEQTEFLDFPVLNLGAP